MVNNINNNTISETLAKQHLNALNKIKKKEIKNKRLINGQKELLNLFDDLLTILNNSNNKNNNSNNNSNNNESDSENKNENESENESEKESENDDDDYDIKQINDSFKMINETKSFEEQINLLREIDYLNEYWHMCYDDNKELNLKIFKLTYAYLSNDLDEKLFEGIFRHTFVTLANKLINIISKEENQIIISDIKKKIKIKSTSKMILIIL